MMREHDREDQAKAYHDNPYDNPLRISSQ